MKLARRTTHIAFALALVVVLGACAPTGANAPAGANTSTPSTAPFPNAVPGPEVSVAVAAELLDEGAFVLDVREPDEYAAGHIRSATLIPLGQLAARVSEVPLGRAVVVVCRTGNRSAQGRDILLGAGYSAVTSMAGGITEWIAAGQPILTGP